MEGLGLSQPDPHPKRRKLSDGTSPELCLDLATSHTDQGGVNFHALLASGLPPTMQTEDAAARQHAWMQYTPQHLPPPVPPNAAAAAVQEDRSLPVSMRSDVGISASTTPSLDLQLPHFPSATDSSTRFEHRPVGSLPQQQQQQQQQATIATAPPYNPTFDTSILNHFLRACATSSAAIPALSDVSGMYAFNNNNNNPNSGISNNNHANSDLFSLQGVRRDGGDFPARVPTPPQGIMSFPSHNSASLAAFQSVLAQLYASTFANQATSPNFLNAAAAAAALPSLARRERTPPSDGMVQQLLASSAAGGLQDGMPSIGGTSTSVGAPGPTASTASAAAANAAAAASQAATAAAVAALFPGASNWVPPGLAAFRAGSTSTPAAPSPSSAHALQLPAGGAMASVLSGMAVPFPGSAAAGGATFAAPTAPLPGFATAASTAAAAAAATASATAVSPPLLAGFPATPYASAAGAGGAAAAPHPAGLSNGGAAAAVYTLDVGTTSAAEATALLGPPGAYTAREEFLMQAEAEGELAFVYVENDGREHNMIYLTGLKNIFSKQLPNMPREYIFRLVLDRRHKSVALVKRNGMVMGGITYRAFVDQKFGEIAFCAVSSNEQVKGYGTRLMNYTKEYARTKDRLTHFLTYADNNAVGYFSKQGFTREITMPRERWHGYIKDYDGGTLMECAFHSGICHTKFPQLIRGQRHALETVLRCLSRSHVVHPGLADAFKAAEAAAGMKPPGGPAAARKLTAAQWGLRPGAAPPIITRTPVPIGSIPGVREAGWAGPEGFEASFKLLLDGHVVPVNRDNLNSFMTMVLDRLVAHDDSWPFREPVRAEDVPDYHDVIKNPIDLSLIRARLEGQTYYMTLDIFVADVRRICGNCRLYNAPDTQYFKAANKFEALLDALLSSHVVLDRHK